MLPKGKLDFEPLLHLAMDRLGLQPQLVNASQPGGK